MLSSRVQKSLSSKAVQFVAADRMAEKSGLPIIVGMQIMFPSLVQKVGGIGKCYPLGRLFYQMLVDFNCIICPNILRVLIQLTLEKLQTQHEICSLKISMIPLLLQYVLSKTYFKICNEICRQSNLLIHLIKEQSNIF